MLAPTRYRAARRLSVAVAILVLAPEAIGATDSSSIRAAAAPDRAVPWQFDTGG